MKIKKKHERYFAKCKRAKFAGTTKYLFDVPIRIVYNGCRVYCRLISDHESEFYYAEYYIKNGGREEIFIIEHSISFDFGNEIGWIHNNLRQPFFDWLNKTIGSTEINDKKIIIYNEEPEPNN